MLEELCDWTSGLAERLDSVITDYSSPTDPRCRRIMERLEAIANDVEELDFEFTVQLMEEDDEQD